MAAGVTALKAQRDNFSVYFRPVELRFLCTERMDAFRTRASLILIVTCGSANRLGFWLRGWAEPLNQMELVLWPVIVALSISDQGR